MQALGDSYFEFVVVSTLFFSFYVICIYIDGGISVMFSVTEATFHMTSIILNTKKEYLYFSRSWEIVLNSNIFFSLQMVKRDVKYSVLSLTFTSNLM